MNEMNKIKPKINRQRRPLCLLFVHRTLYSTYKHAYSGQNLQLLPADRPYSRRSAAHGGIQQ